MKGETSHFFIKENIKRLFRGYSSYFFERNKYCLHSNEASEILGNGNSNHIPQSKLKFQENISMLD